MLLVLSGRMVARLRGIITRQFRSPHNRRRHPQKIGAKACWRRNMMATLLAVVGLFCACQRPRKINVGGHGHNIDVTKPHGQGHDIKSWFQARKPRSEFVV